MTKEIQLVLTGLTCGACVRRVDQKLRALPGVTDVRVDLATGNATITREVGGEEIADLLAAVERAGYGASLSPGATP